MLPEEFKELVRRIFVDQHGEYAKRRYEESREELERIAARSSGMAIGALLKAESDAVLDIQRVKGEQLWEAMKEVLDAFAFKYYPELPNELLEFGESFLPGQEPRVRSRFSAQQLPEETRDAQKQCIKEGFISARIRAQNIVRNNIDLYCRRMQIISPLHGVSIAVNPPISDMTSKAEAPLSTVNERPNKASLTGSGAIAQGPGAVAVGSGGVSIGGDVHGSIIITNRGD